VTWAVSGDRLEVQVRDEGPGLPATSNLFVPFFTTKPNGSGIGLVFCRQVAEAHGGEVSLSSRADRRGTVARVRLPLSASE
jgi:signal transduction histidine kinase